MQKAIKEILFRLNFLYSDKYEIPNRNKHFSDGRT